MTTTDVINPQTFQHLVIAKGEDCFFDVEWYEHDGTTPIPILSCTGHVKDKYDGTVIADLGETGYSTIVDGVIQVRIPAADTATFEALERGIFAITATSATDTKRLAQGTVRILEDV